MQNAVDMYCMHVCVPHRLHRHGLDALRHDHKRGMYGQMKGYTAAPLNIHPHIMP